MIDTSGRRLYDAATQGRLGRRFARQLAVTIAVCSVIAGGLIGGLHYEETPFLASWLGYCDGARFASECEYPVRLDWLAGMLGALVFGLVLAPLLPRAHRRVKPSVFCRGCDHMGWIEDLVQTEGRCPRCGSFRFDHQQVELDPIFFSGDLLFLPRKAVELDVPGPDLLARFQRSRRKAARG